MVRLLRRAMFSIARLLRILPYRYESLDIMLGWTPQLDVASLPER